MLFYVEFQNTEKKKKSRTVGNNALIISQRQSTIVREMSTIRDSTVSKSTICLTHAQIALHTRVECGISF